MNNIENSASDPQPIAAMVSVRELESKRIDAAINAESFLINNVIGHNLTTDPLLAAMTLQEIIKANRSFAEPFIIALALEATTLVSFHWSVDDVKERRPDLSTRQCQEVLKRCDDKHDASIGMNWDVIDVWADDLFPAPEDIDDQREAYAANPDDFTNSRYVSSREA